MGMLRCAATVSILALLGCAAPRQQPGPGTPGWLGPDLSRIRVTSAVPAPAPRSYAETVSWLAAHTLQHAHGTMTIGEKQITAQSELTGTRYDCVLLHTLTLEAASTGRHTTIGQVLSLPAMYLASIEVTSQTGRSGCVNFLGDDGVVVEIQLAPVMERSRGREGMICFDSREAADAAAEALAHLATLCGAAR
jgi:hypothetical protein